MRIPTEELMLRWLNHHVLAYAAPSPPVPSSHRLSVPTPVPTPRPCRPRSYLASHPFQSDLPSDYRVTDLGASLADGRALTIVLDAIAPPETPCDLSALASANALERCERVASDAQRIGVDSFVITGADLNAPRPRLMVCSVTTIPQLLSPRFSHTPDPAALPRLLSQHPLSHLIPQPCRSSSHLISPDLTCLAAAPLT